MEPQEPTVKRSWEQGFHQAITAWKKPNFKEKSFYSTFLYFLRYSKPCTAITSGSQSTQLFGFLFFKQSNGNKSSRLIKSLKNPEKLSFYIPFLWYLNKGFAPLKCFPTVLVKNDTVILEELLEFLFYRSIYLWIHRFRILGTKKFYVSMSLEWFMYCNLFIIWYRICICIPYWHKLKG